MTTLQLKTEIPQNRHLGLNLELPETVYPGEAEIVVIINNVENDPTKTNQLLREKLLNCPVWTEEDISGFKEFRKEINKWQPNKF